MQLLEILYVILLTVCTYRKWKFIIVKYIKITHAALLGYENVLLWQIYAFKLYLMSICSNGWWRVTASLRCVYDDEPRYEAGILSAWQGLTNRDSNEQVEQGWWGGSGGYVIIFSVNPLRAKFFRVNINMYLYFISFLHIDMTQVLKILPQIR